MATPSLPGPESDVREVPEGVDRPIFGSEWRSYGGYRFREVGRLRWEFMSRSQPGVTYIFDAEDRTCSCWPATRKQTTRPCPHVLLIQAYLRRLATVMNQTPTDL